jgi:predicted nucleotide-binding protein (sugar kinase/HSP70/actin superfamily)
MSLFNWIPNALLPWRKGPYKKRLLEYAAPYLADSVGGFGLESVANTRKLGLEAVDGIIQLFPLGCMPEIVAKSALNKICLWENIPVLSITMDQHDSTTGFITRVEAFLEVLQAQKKERPLGGQTPDIRLPIMKIFFQ